MIDQTSSHVHPSNGPIDVHRNTYRFFCVIAGVLNPLFGVVYGFTDPGAVDPLWARFAVAAAALLLLSLSFMHDGVRERFIGLVRGFFYGLILYLVALTALNGFSPNYSMGLLFAITAVGIAFSLGLNMQMAPLRHYLSFAVLLTVPAALFAGAPQVSVAIVWICAASTSLVIYVAADAKMKADRSVQASEQRYYTLMSAASDAIFISDPSTGRLIDANQKAQELVGRSLDELRHMSTGDLFPPDDRPRYVALFEAHVFEKQPIAEDLFVTHRSGDCIPIDVSASLVDVGGRKFIQSTFRRHRYEQQLIEAKERAEELLCLKTSLLNNMSHELRTPVTCILSYAEMVNERAGGEMQEYTRVIKESATRLHDTLNSILGLAQLESGTASLNLQTLDVADVAAESVALLKPLAEKKGIDLQTCILTEKPFATVDEVCLGRIVNNLVGNAVKFTEQGYVRVEIDGDAESIRLHVRDSGIGISPSFLPHLFGEFRQESTGLARNYEGNGLGLAITKRLVGLLQGSISVESRKDEGSVFTVTLPRASAPEASADADAAGDEVHVARSGKRILVVEDNAYTRSMLVERLSDFFTVDAASDPTTALRKAARTGYDAFFLDVNLAAPQNGLDILKALRRMSRYADTPVAALTAYAMPGDREHFLSSGFDFYLKKPFTKRELLQVARALAEEEGSGPGASASRATASLAP